MNNEQTAKLLISSHKPADQFTTMSHCAYNKVFNMLHSTYSKQHFHQKEVHKW